MQISAELLAENRDFVLFAAVVFGFVPVLRWFVQRAAPGARLPGYIWIIAGAFVMVIGIRLVLVTNEAKAKIEYLLSDVAPIIAEEMERLGHARLTLQTPPDDPLYLQLIELEKRVLKMTPGLMDVYTMRRRPDGKVVLMVDSETDYDRNGVYNGDREERTPLGRVYDHEDKGLSRALRGEANFDERVYTDEWGASVSAWVPLRAPDGTLDGVLGVDCSAESWLEAIRSARMELLLGNGSFALVLAGLIGAFTVTGANTRSRALLEAKVAQSEKFRSLVINAGNEAVVTVDGEARILSWNSRAESLFGWPADQSPNSQGLEKILDAETCSLVRAKVVQLDFSAPLPEAKLRGRRFDQSEFELGLRLADLGLEENRIVSLFIRDLAEEREAERRARRAERMESLSMMAAGVARDLRETFDPIYTVITRTAAAAPRRDSGEALLGASAEKMLRLVERLTSYAEGSREGRLQAIYSGEVIAAALRTLTTTMPKNIQLVQRVPADLPPIQGDAAQLTKVLLCLSANARDAMPGGGTLTLDAGRRQVEKDHAGGVPSGDYIWWKVADSGKGLKPSDAKRIFDPYFTTHDRPFAVGLGLAEVWGIIRGHSGFISFKSVIGAGSTFEILFPVASATHTAAPAQGGMILVLDHEQASRQSVAQGLSARGRTVLSAANAVEGLALLAQHQNKIAFVIINQDLRTEVGINLAQALARISPAAKIILTHAQPLAESARRYESRQVVARIPSEVAPEDLAEAIAKII
jgi:PAS domain S-box-containing protein